MGVEIAVPLGLFAMIFGIVWVVSQSNARKRNEINQTIRHAIDKGQTLSPDVLDRLARASDTTLNDLRRGVTFIAVAGAMVVFGYMMSPEDPDLFRVMSGAAAFPGFVGLASIALWAGTRRGRKD
jgi:primosomal protein N'